MQTQERDRISNSIINQLQIKDTVICNAISDNVNKAVLVNYDSIKLLSKTLKDKLKLLGFDSQHSIILNVISKALGYQNHHSMKKNFEKNPSVIEDIKTSMSDSILKRFFSIKDEFVSKFGIEKLKISNYPDKEYIFDFMYPKQSSTKQKNKIKEEYLRESGKGLFFFTGAGLTTKNIKSTEKIIAKCQEKTFDGLPVSDNESKDLDFWLNKAYPGLRERKIFLVI